MQAPARRDYGGDAGTKWRDLWAAGQGLHAVNAVEPVAAIVATLTREFEAAGDAFVRRVSGTTG